MYVNNRSSLSLSLLFLSGTTTTITSSLHLYHQPLPLPEQPTNPPAPPSTTSTSAAATSPTPTTTPASKNSPTPFNTSATKTPLWLEVVGFQQVQPTELLYKKCSSGRIDGSGFDERLEAALSLVPKGVSNGKGYYAGAYQGVYVLGQCEGDLGGGECVNCVKSTVEIGRCEFRNSVSGHVFLQQCYVSYTYYPDGVPGAGK
ncbi:putative Gnk2-like domain-containing protein [Helianthus debilis subsp. tardiflorus]